MTDGEASGKEQCKDPSSVGASRHWKAAPSIHPISPCWAERKGDLWGQDNRARTTLTTPPAGIDKRPVLRLSLWRHSWRSPSAFAALHNPPLLPGGPQDFSWCCSSSAPPQAGQLGLALPGACEPCGKSLFDILFFRDTCSSVSQETIRWLSRWGNLPYSLFSFNYPFLPNPHTVTEVFSSHRVMASRQCWFTPRTRLPSQWSQQGTADQTGQLVRNRVAAFGVSWSPSQQWWWEEVLGCVVQPWPHLAETGLPDCQAASG